jgi:hypothetical protein
VQPISELITVPGVTLAGPLPPEIQQQTVYAAAISATSTSPDAAHALLAALAAPAVHPALIEKGMTAPEQGSESKLFCIRIEQVFEVGRGPGSELAA